MTNTLNLEERTLAQLADPEDSINKVGADYPRKYGLQPLVVRATDHVYNVEEEENDASKMAIFRSTELGDIWLLGGADGALNSVNVATGNDNTATGIRPNTPIARMFSTSGTLRCNGVLTELEIIPC